MSNLLFVWFSLSRLNSAWRPRVVQQRRVGAILIGAPSFYGGSGSNFVLPWIMQIILVHITYSPVISSLISSSTFVYVPHYSFCNIKQKGCVVCVWLLIHSYDWCNVSPSATRTKMFWDSSFSLQIQERVHLVLMKLHIDGPFSSCWNMILKTENRWYSDTAFQVHNI